MWKSPSTPAISTIRYVDKCGHEMWTLYEPIVDSHKTGPCIHNEQASIHRSNHKFLVITHRITTVLSPAVGK